MERPFLRREVGIDHDRARAAHEIAQRLVERGIAELEVRGIDEIAGRAADAVGERTTWMVDAKGGDVERADRELTGGDSSDVGAVGQALERDREVRRLENPRHPRLVVRFERRRIHRRRPARSIEGRQKRETLHVIPVIVREEQADAARLALERFAQSDDPGTGVEDQQFSRRFVEQFDARRVAAVGHGGRRSPGRRAANPPKTDAHVDGCVKVACRCRPDDTPPHQRRRTRAPGSVLQVAAARPPHRRSKPQV